MSCGVFIPDLHEKDNFECLRVVFIPLNQFRIAGSSTSTIQRVAGRHGTENKIFDPQQRPPVRHLPWWLLAGISCQAGPGPLRWMSVGDIFEIKSSIVPQLNGMLQGNSSCLKVYQPNTVGTSKWWGVHPRWGQNGQLAYCFFANAGAVPTLVPCPIQHPANDV